MIVWGETPYKRVGSLWANLHLFPEWFVVNVKRYVGFSE